MAQECDFKEELLKQNGDSSNRSDTAVGSAQQLIARDTARVRHMKKVTQFSWLLVVISFLAAGTIEALPGPHPDWFAPAAIIVAQALLIIAVSFTISLYVRSRTLTLHELQARLAKIEEHLRRIAGEK
jgi:hypothetical protein